jgi:glycosyltransferase involved in cell wall biosynthesis
MRLLVISYAFPPYNSIGGVRVGKTVKYLLDFGHDVRVLTAQEQPFLPTLPVEIPAERITYTKWLSVRRGSPVTRQSVGAGASRNGSSGRGTKLKTALKQVLSSSYKNLLDFPDSNIGWLPYAVSAASRLFESWKPELMLASSPPPTSLVVAYRLARKFGVPWVADLRDLWMDHPYYKPPGWRKAVEERLERRVLSSAAGMVTVSEPLAETLKAKFGKQAAVVLNGFDPADYPVNSEVPFDDGRLKILYTGMIYPGKRDPSPLFEALRRLGPLAERVRVVFHGNFLETVHPMAERYGVAHLVEVNEPVPYKESLQMQASADVLLLLLWSDSTERGVYTGKMFEYMGARRPILAVGGTETVAADLIRERGVGMALDTPTRIAEQLERWIKQKQMSGAIPSLRPETIARVSREEQTRVLEKYLIDVLSSMASLNLT